MMMSYSKTSHNYNPHLFRVQTILVSLLVLSFFLATTITAYPKKAPLNVGYYRKTCPNAEHVVRKVVDSAVSKNPALAAGLIRLLFHDCFVRGCDASVLLDPLGGLQSSERDHPANNGSLRGFEVIDAAKAQLEAFCPKTVSCADILAFAARDGAYKVGKIWYDVPAGRRDGRVSLFNDVPQNLPPPFFNVTQLRDNFARKGFTLDEMVTLSGAHSIGVAHCSSFSSRLYPVQDPSMDPLYATYLKTICPPVPSPSLSPLTSNNGTLTVAVLGGEGAGGGKPQTDPTVAQDFLTPDRLDNKYYMDLKMKRGILSSDQTLMSSPITAKMVTNNARYGSTWAAKFAAAMVKLGNLDVLTHPDQGEIRNNCHLINH